jgi:phospholipase/carboxylesterase
MATQIRTIERKPHVAVPAAPPLLLLLHGYGSNEHDLFDLADWLDPRLHVVSARAPLALPWGGFAWYHLGGAPGNLVPDPASRAAALDLLAKFVADLPARVGADPRRVYLLGFSQGAVLSLGLAMRAPERLAGVVVASGYLDPALRIDPPSAGLTDLPVLQIHGAYDDVIPISAAHATRAILGPLLTTYTYHEDPAGHTIHPDGLRRMQQWMADRLGG